MPFSNEMMNAFTFNDWLERVYVNSIDILGYDNTHSLDCDIWVGKYKHQPAECNCRLAKKE